MISLLLNIQRLIMKSSLILGCFILTVSMISCSISKQSTEHSDLDRLAQLMVGTFNTKAQSARDSQFYNIQLKMCRIWTQDPNQYWLYVEQATAKTLNKPYRQRIYKLEQISKKQFVSKVYNIPSPELAMSIQLKSDTPACSLPLKEALHFLRGDSIIAESEMEGWHLIHFEGHALGWAKKIRQRWNNYYPKDWRIRMAIPK